MHGTPARGAWAQYVHNHSEQRCVEVRTRRWHRECMRCVMTGTAAGGGGAYPSYDGTAGEQCSAGTGWRPPALRRSSHLALVCWCFGAMKLAKAQQQQPSWYPLVYTKVTGGFDGHDVTLGPPEAMCSVTSRWVHVPNT